MKTRTGLHHLRVASRLAGLFALLVLEAFPAQLAAQSATLRLGVPNDPFPGLLRPETFCIARRGVVPLTESLEHLTFLGAFIDRLGRPLDSLTPKVAIDGKSYDRAASGLYAATDGRTLRLEVRCSEPQPGGMATDFSFYFPDDRVEFDLDLNHDHHTFERVAVLPNGKMQQWAYSVTENDLACDRHFTTIKSSLSVTSRAQLNTDGWSMRVDIPLPDSFITPGGWAAIGLNAVRFRGVHGEETTMWCPDSNRVWAPIYFGDLYLGAPPAVIKAVNLGRVCWGENPGRIELERGSFPGTAKVSTFNYAGLFRSSETTFSGTSARFEYSIDPHELMQSALAVSLDGHEWGRYVFGWKRGLLLTQRPTGQAKAPRPAPGEADYQWKLARYVLDRLPLLSRSPDGLTLSGPGLTVPLSTADPFTSIAQYIMTNFSDDDTRLIAAALVLCQRGAMVSSGRGEEVEESLGPAGTLRNGAAFCNSYADMLRELISRISDSTSQPFRTVVVNFKDGPINTWGWPHHWLAGVSYRGGLTLLDSELGTFFVDPENGHLATLQQLLAHPDWADSTSHGLSEYYRNRPLTDFVVRESGDFWILE